MLKGRRGQLEQTRGLGPLQPGAFPLLDGDVAREYIAPVSNHIAGDKRSQNFSQPLRGYRNSRYGPDQT